MNRGMISISHWGMFLSPFNWDYEGSPWFYVAPERERWFTFEGDFG